MERKESVTRKLSSTINDDDRFDRVMEKVGYRGKFQLQFNLIFNFLLVGMVSMPFVNIILALAVPDHWCHVPGRNSTNYTEQEWKELTLPKEYDIKGTESPSKCKMYNISLENMSSREFNVSQHEIIDCQYGWDFDRTWYTETAPSEGVWVCEKELFVSNAFAFGRIGDVVGTCVFGQLGDVLGRQPVFFITLFTLIAGRTLSAFTVNNYSVFVFATLLASLSSTAVFQSPLIVAMEISEESRRAHIAMLQCIGWTIGVCFMPFILWAMGHWFQFMLTTTLPCVIFLFSSRWMIESPRWLASQGKIARCIKQLERIAAVNGTTVPEDAIITLRQKTENSEKAYGILSLFTSWRLVKNTAMLLISWINGSLIGYVLILNVSSLQGNPFMNFFWQGIVELPSFLLAKSVCDRIGRRWNQVIFSFLACLGLIGMASLITDPEKEAAVVALMSFIKFCAAFVFYGTNLQTLEIYPTCVRQSGLSLCILFASAFAILAPYIVYLGTSYYASFTPIILAGLAFTGATAALFLPETLHQKLPETLADAQVFGANQKFWSWPQKKTEKVDNLINGSLIGYVLVLNVSSLEGNPFMNFFWQGIVELPAYLVAKSVCDKIGRRWNQVTFCFLACVGLIGMAFFITDPEYGTAVVVLMSLIKFCTAFVSYGTCLQTLEIFPTCVRQSGLSLCILLSDVFSIFGPYIVYLGTSFHASFTPITLACLAFTGAIAALFLPETLHEKLPETIADAQVFGANQRFWSWPQKKTENADNL